MLPAANQRMWTTGEVSHMQIFGDKMCGEWVTFDGGADVKLLLRACILRRCGFAPYQGVI